MLTHIRTISLVIILTLGCLNRARAEDFPFNLKTLENAIFGLSDLAKMPGNFRAVKHNLSNNTKEYFRIADEPYEVQQTEFDVASSDTTAAPQWIQEFLQSLENIVFNKVGLINVRVSKTEFTHMLYDARIIIINEKDLEYSVEDLKLLIAHEFSHFITDNYQIQSPTGLTPSGFTSVTLWDGDTEMQWDLIHDPIEHAEVDIIACILLKKLNAEFSLGFLEKILLNKDTFLDGHPLPPHAVEELNVRLRVIRSFMQQN